MLIFSEVNKIDYQSCCLVTFINVQQKESEIPGEWRLTETWYKCYIFCFRQVNILDLSNLYIYMKPMKITKSL